MDDINFCPACGRNVSPGTEFCPACGMRLSGPAEVSVTAVTEKKGRDRINIAVALILLYSVPLIFLGLYVLVNAAAIAEMLFKFYEDTPVYSVLTEYYTVETMTAFLKQTAAAAIAGGAAGITSAVLALKRRLWAPTILLCLMSAGIAIMSLIGLVMGLIAFWLLYKAKPAFAD